MGRYGTLKEKHLRNIPDGEDWLSQHKRLLKGAKLSQNGYTGNDPMMFHKAVMQEASMQSGRKGKRFTVDLSA